MVDSYIIHVDLLARIALISCTVSVLIFVAQKRNEVYVISNGFTSAAVVKSKYAKDNRTIALQTSSRVVAYELDVTLHFAEQGSPIKDAGKLADELDLTRKVWFLSFRRDVPDLVNAVDGYVVSSVW